MTSPSPAREPLTRYVENFEEVFAEVRLDTPPPIWRPTVASMRRYLALGVIETREPILPWREYPSNAKVQPTVPWLLEVFPEFGAEELAAPLDYFLEVEQPSLIRIRELDFVKQLSPTARFIMRLTFAAIVVAAGVAIWKLIGMAIMIPIFIALVVLAMVTSLRFASMFPHTPTMILLNRSPQALAELRLTLLKPRDLLLGGYSRMIRRRMPRAFWFAAELLVLASAAAFVWVISRYSSYAASAAIMGCCAAHALMRLAAGAGATAVMTTELAGLQGRVASRQFRGVSIWRRARHEIIQARHALRRGWLMIRLGRLDYPVFIVTSVLPMVLIFRGSPEAVMLITGLLLLVIPYSPLLRRCHRYNKLSVLAYAAKFEWSVAAYWELQQEELGES